MTPSGHAHSDHQYYDIMCHVTRKWPLNIAKKIKKYVSCMAHTAQRNDCELILMVKMDRDHLVLNFQQSVIIVGLQRPEVT